MLETLQLKNLLRGNILYINKIIVNIEQMKHEFLANESMKFKWKLNARYLRAFGNKVNRIDFFLEKYFNQKLESSQQSPST